MYSAEDRIKELMERDLKISQAQQKTVEENPLLAYSITQLKAEIKRRKEAKKNGGNKTAVRY